VQFNKGVDFIGRAALAAAAGQPLRKKLVTLVLGDATDYAWGGEAILAGGAPVGELSSAGWSPRAGACVALGYVRGALANQPHAGTPVQIDLWGRAVPATAWDRWPPPAAA